MLTLLCGLLPAEARSWRPAQLPNGQVFNCATCHVRTSGGGPRNAFGEAVRSLVNPGSRTPFWGPVLARLDSDGDGFTNGQELGDPEGDGTPTPGAEVTHPGNPSSKPADEAPKDPILTELLFAFNSKTLTLTWKEDGTLLSAPTMNGPWTAVGTATSPYTTSVDGEVHVFFRIGDEQGSASTQAVNQPERETTQASDPLKKRTNARLLR